MKSFNTMRELLHQLDIDMVQWGRLQAAFVQHGIGPSPTQHVDYTKLITIEDTNEEF